LWAQFFPDQEVPAPVPKGDPWKLQPLPLGVDRLMLQEWSKAVEWPIHPVRPIGSRAWLVTASEAPPKDIMYYNSEPLIIRKLPAKSPQKAVGLVAGPVSKKPIHSLRQKPSAHCQCSDKENHMLTHGVVGNPPRCSRYHP
jgi:hypothetical protein